MNATANNGDVWTGEKQKEGGTLWWIYRDAAGHLYESKEVPAYRIHLDNAALIPTQDGWAIGPKKAR